MYFVMKLSKLCNLRCTYCYEYDELGQKTRMPLEQLAFFFAGVADCYARQSWNVPLRFVLHGGEPALLPLAYLREFSRLQREHLGMRGIPYNTSLQTNLTHVSRAFLDVLVENDIGLGISMDVFGQQRLNRAGKDSQDGVLDNLQRLFDLNLIRRLSVGAITVMHRENIKDAVNTFLFFDSLKLSYRILPIFSLTDPPPRMRHLTLAPGEVVAALKKVARAHAGSGSDIQIHPLNEYLTAAIRHLAGRPADPYDPNSMEWALIVNTNGDVYNHSEAYLPHGLMGNIFAHSLTDILASAGRKHTLALRTARGATCERCAYCDACSHVPVIEALPSERYTDASQSLQCLVAKPMIDFLVKDISGNQAALAMVNKVSPRADAV